VTLGGLAAKEKTYQRYNDDEERPKGKDRIVAKGSCQLEAIVVDETISGTFKEVIDFSYTHGAY
jgi:hypothetical protein